MNTRYVVTGVSENQHMWVGIDQASGGYPYWTDQPSQIATFKTIDDAMKAVDISYMFQQASSVQVCTIDYVTTPVKKIHADLHNMHQQLKTDKRELERLSSLLVDAINNSDTVAQVSLSEDIAKAGQSIKETEYKLNLLAN